MVDLDVTELAGTRFAISPLAETIAALLLLSGRATAPALFRFEVFYPV